MVSTSNLAVIIPALLMLMQSSSAKLCDIRLWYQELNDNGQIDEKLNDEQELLIDKIERKIKNLKYSGNPKVVCTILADYTTTLYSQRHENQKSPNKEGKSTDFKDIYGLTDDTAEKRTSTEKEYLVWKQKVIESVDDSKKIKKYSSKIPPTANTDKLEITKNQNQDDHINHEIKDVEANEFDPTESDVDETELIEEEEYDGNGGSEQKDSNNSGDKTITESQNVGHVSALAGSESTPLYLFQGITHACGKQTECSLLCYYCFQNQQSLFHYPNLESKIIGSLVENEDHPEQQNTRDGADTYTKFTAYQRNSDLEHKQKNNQDGGRSIGEGSVEKNLHKDEAGEKLRIQSIEEEKPNEDPTQLNFNKENSETMHHREMKLENIDQRFQQQSSEYASKFQQLEILYMKLENQLLNKQLDKQNDTNSFTKLEFQILKLENELLKLNQSYAQLHEDNKMLKRQHERVDQGRSLGKYAALPEANSTKHMEIITQQQLKISHLTDWLNNQTNTLNQLRDKSDGVVAQNQILYQIVMNQTALIQNIMKKVQDMSDENMAHRKDTQDMKSKMDLQDISVKLLKRLDNLASTEEIKTHHKVNNVKSNNNRTGRFKFLPDVPDATINTNLWKCRGLLSPQICYLYSFLLSPCPPFSRIHWRKCNEFISERTASHYMKYLQEYPEGKPVKKHTSNASKKTDDDQEHSRNRSEDNKPVTLDVKSAKSSKEEVGEVQKNREGRQVKNRALKDVNNENPSQKGVLFDEESGERFEKKDDVNDNQTKLGESNEDEDDKYKEERGTRLIKYKVDGLRKPKDCYEIYQKGSTRNGVYKIFLPGLKYYVEVFCDMKEGGWTVIQKRDSGKLDFYKNWQAYKDGFGDESTEYYLGNDNIHFLTNQGHYSLQVELVNWKKERRSAIYKDFWIDDESEGFKLHVEGYGGDAGDGLSKHNEMKFSTYDVDNDKVVKELGGSCAKRFHGAGWYFKCYSSNLNGQFYKNGVVPSKKFDGIAWKPWTGPNYSLKDVILKLRPKDVLDD